jgi:solute carrier family 10 (sodium/bile acid cotransporter), member 7
MRSFLSKHWFLSALALGLGSTLLFPGVLHHVTDYFEPRITVGLSLFLMAWMMPAHSLLAEVRHPLASIWAVVLSYGLVPVFACMLGYLAPHQVQIGLILVSSVPCTLSAAVLWTRLAGGNEATALLAVVGTILISWFATPLLLSVLTGTSLEPGVINEIMLDLIVSLIVPMLAGQALRLIGSCARFADRHRIPLAVLAQCCVVAIVLKAGVAVGGRLQAENALNTPEVIAWSIGLAVTLHLIALAVGMISCRLFGFDRGRQIAVAFSASQKTLQVSLLLYDVYFKVEHPLAVMPLLFYHVGQLMLDTVIAKRIAARASLPSADVEPMLD